MKSRHSPPDRFPGTIDQPVVPPVRAAAYRCGEAWSALVHHRPSGRRLLIQGSAGFVKGSLTGRQAEVVYLGVGQLGVQPESYLVDYWTETVRAVGARRVVLVHWDDFFRPSVEAVARLALRGRRLGRVAARPEQAGRAGRRRAGHADGVATRRPVGLSLTLLLASCRWRQFSRSRLPVHGAGQRRSPPCRPWCC